MNSLIVPAVSLTTARSGASTKPNELGMRVMQSRAYDRRGEQYLLIKSPPASGKSRALMFIALDKLKNQGIKQATYTYYEQLNGYEHLKSLDIGYFFYSGRYLDAIMKVLDPALKTIVHIPNVNSKESTKDKIREAEEIMSALGEWQGSDPVTGFQLIKLPDGRTIKVADIVDDDPGKREKVVAALKDPAARMKRDHVDIIIALGMAKEGFDWIWCEHALTVGYRSSLTEIIQIIGRATRDAPGKARARFTNLIAEPDASQEAVVDAVNDTLKAIAASLLMEQVLAPRFNFTPKDSGPKDGFDYGPDGYVAGQTNAGFSEERGEFHFEIKGLVTPESPEATRAARNGVVEDDGWPAVFDLHCCGDVACIRVENPRGSNSNSLGQRSNKALAIEKRKFRVAVLRSRNRGSE